MVDFSEKEERALESIEKLKQPIEIPGQLRCPEFGFVLLTPRDKRPVEQGWTNIVRRFDDPVLLEHIGKWGNYGVRCGFGGLNVIDADTKEVRECAERLGETFTVQTGGGGRHYYIKCPELDKKIILFDDNEKHLGEIQSTGTQVVGPSCVHPSGNRYVIIADVPILEVTKEKLLATFSEYIDKPEKPLQEEREITFPITKLIKVEDYVRHGDELQGAHPVHGSGTGQNFCVNVSKNMWHCFRCNTGGGPLSLIAVLEGLIECKEVKAGALKPKWRELVKIAREKYGLQITELTSENFFSMDENGKTHWRPEGAYLELSKVYQFVKVMGEKRLYFYKEGVWKSGGEEVIKAALSQYMPDNFRSHYVNEAVDYIEGKSLINGGFDENRNLICLSNGVLNIETREVTPWSPEYHLTAKLPVKYKADALCPAIDKFLSEVVKTEDIQNIYEMFGYCLYRDMPIHRSFMLVGEGSNGKTTLVKLFRAFLGTDNIVSISIQELNENKFAASRLYHKLANLHADLTAKQIWQTGMFKMTTGGDMISGEEKFGGIINFTNYAKYVFACNQVPDAKDDSDAYFRRWVIINFPNRFEGAKADKKLIDKLTTEDELSGLLNKALDALKALMDRGEFSNVQTTDEMRERYVRLASPTKAFIMDKIEEGVDYWVATEDLFIAFKKYCEEKNYPVVSKEGFMKKMKSEIVNMRAEKNTINGVRVHGLSGIRLAVEEKLPDQPKLPEKPSSTDDKGGFVNYA